MTVAVITGASAGLGREFLAALPELYPGIDEYWLIARRREKLEEAARSVPVQCRIFPFDLTNDDSYRKLADYTAEFQPDIRLLINNSGCGFLGNVGEGELSNQTAMIDLNLKGLTAVTHVLLPYMNAGAAILNVSSIASFCPNARMTVYSAGKAYVTAFTHGIREELRGRGITATAVCPGPMDTEFIKIGGIKGHSKTFDILPYCDPAKVAKESLRACRRGVTVYTPKAFYKLYRVIAKVLPTKLMIKFAKT